MAEMTMIEDENGNFKWECNACNAQIKDRDDFELKVKTCRNCKEKITAFHSLFDENGDYL